MNNGIVYLVGAGPGDMGLLTLRAAELISCAEVLVYDNLVNKKIISSFCPESCEKIYVGKSGSSHTLEQDGINELIALQARKGKRVVRLKGGDPYIFGRGGEEALYLQHNNVPFEVVNGVSSAYAVPACAGIPVTHRGLAASVAFITGHEDPTKFASDIHWDKIATGIQTLVFLMGVKNLPLIVEKLMENGRDPETPVAVIQNGCGPAQKSVSGTLENIYRRVADAGISPPSIIVVGEVVALREKINWFENRPLFGKSIVVTRSRDQASRMVEKFSGAGALVIEVPAIRILPPEDASEIHRCIENLDGYDWLLFTSVNGVSHFFQHLLESGRDARALARMKIGAIGTATGERLLENGIRADLVPEKFVSSEIVNALRARSEVQGKKFLLPRADIAPDDLAEELARAGAAGVHDLSVYRTVIEEFDGSTEASRWIDGRDFDLVTFTSSSTVINFAGILRKRGIEDFRGIVSACIGPVTAKTARELGFDVAVMSEVHTIDGLFSAVVEYFGKM